MSRRSTTTLLFRVSLRATHSNTAVFLTSFPPYTRVDHLSIHRPLAAADGLRSSSNPARLFLPRCSYGLPGLAYGVGCCAQAAGNPRLHGHERDVRRKPRRPHARKRAALHADARVRLVGVRERAPLSCASAQRCYCTAGAHIDRGGCAAAFRTQQRGFASCVGARAGAPPHLHARCSQRAFFFHGTCAPSALLPCPPPRPPFRAAPRPSFAATACRTRPSRS